MPIRIMALADSISRWNVDGELDDPDRSRELLLRAKLLLPTAD